jgi:hypothetical protein
MPIPLNFQQPRRWHTSRERHCHGLLPRVVYSLHTITVYAACYPSQMPPTNRDQVQATELTHNQHG